MNKIKYITIPVQEHVHHKFSNRCGFYDLTYQDFFLHVIEKFINGEFDEELNIKPIDGR